MAELTGQVNEVSGEDLSSLAILIIDFIFAKGAFSPSISGVRSV